ncbi:salicylic acid-binding protein 2-like [Papaver somniferum]|uniref:salicylic acid-binding protein 2-like n=1 Tax=Papaver somniferum TaxID=3469 RepID=UPI000E6FE837|nr:salicylic acid-binding protein 2-like [Papaver somniferum]
MLLQGSTGDSVYTYDEGVKDVPTTFICGPNYLSSTLYNLSPPEDIALAIILMRPVRMYSMKDMLKEIAMSKQKYGSVKRVYILSEQDKAISKDFRRSIIENDPTDEVKEITGSDYMVMISQPQQLFVCLQEIAEKA